MVPIIPATYLTPLLLFPPPSQKKVNSRSREQLARLLCSQPPPPSGNKHTPPRSFFGGAQVLMGSSRRGGTSGCCCQAEQGGAVRACMRCKPERAPVAPCSPRESCQKKDRLPYLTLPYVLPTVPTSTIDQVFGVEPVVTKQGAEARPYAYVHERSACSACAVSPACYIQ